MPDTHKYEATSGNDDDDLDSQPMLKSLQQATPSPTKKTVVGLYVVIAILVAAIVALGSMVVQERHALRESSAATSNISSTLDKLSSSYDSLVNSAKATADVDLPFTDIKHCGSNAEEARGLGCVYDVMMQEWTPVECYDGVLTEKYLASNNWTWYRDSSGERTMSDEEIRLGNHSVVFAIQDYHKHHCVFTWEKLIRALRTNSPILEKLISYDHLTHCEHRTLFAAKEVFGVSAPTGFSRCAPFAIWQRDFPDTTVDIRH